MLLWDYFIYIKTVFPVLCLTHILAEMTRSPEFFFFYFLFLTLLSPVEFVCE